MSQLLWFAGTEFEYISYFELLPVKAEEQKCLY